MRLLLLISLCLISTVSRAALPHHEIITSGVPKPSEGTVTRLSVYSTYLNDNMTVDVWMPEGYTEGEHYPVVYTHDGQNLFDPSMQPSGVVWEVDRACGRLAADPDFAMPIIVGISNREALRPNDLFPEKSLNYISPDDVAHTFIYYNLNNTFYGDEYAAFIARELKPLIDSLFATEPSRSHTFVMGSSMGGLASLYIMCEYPELFGGAACLSTHWVGSLVFNANGAMIDDEVCAFAMLDYMSDNLPVDTPHRLYLDQGTVDWDACYQKYEVIAREIAREKGYREDNSRLYTHTAIGAGHNQWYWQQRVNLPLGFLLSKSAIAAASVKTVTSDYAPATGDDKIHDLAGRAYDPASAPLLRPGIYIRNGKKIILP